MTTEIQTFAVPDMQTMAASVAKSRLFGLDEAQAFTLMLLAQSEGIHPVKAVQRYHVIQGRPAMRPTRCWPTSRSRRHSRVAHESPTTARSARPCSTPQARPSRQDDSIRHERCQGGWLGWQRHLESSTRPA